MDKLLEIYFLPPMAIARCGSSPTPMDSYEWTTTSTPADASSTVIQPAVSFDVGNDGAIRPRLPREIVFRDGDDGPIRLSRASHAPFDARLDAPA